VNLFAAISAEDMRIAQIVTGATMAAFIGVGLAPGLRRHAGRVRGALVVVYLLICVGFVGFVLVR
jgi:hypothetical protein